MDVDQSDIDQRIDKRDVTLFVFKKDTSDTIHYISLTLRSGETFIFPLVWMVFGSKTSLDCDLIVLISLEFVELKPRPDICNKMCEILDGLVGPIVGTTKEINSSVGYWHDGQIRWAQKGSDLGEVNNGIMATFNNHLDLQILSSCPLTVRLERDVWYKIQTTIRDILCKMNKSRYRNDSILMIHRLLVSIFNIPEIMKLPRNEKKSYVCPLLQGIFIQPVIRDELSKILPMHKEILCAITATADIKRKRLKPIDEILLFMEKQRPIDAIVMSILADNSNDGTYVLRILSALDNVKTVIPAEQYERLRKILLDLMQSGVIRLNRVIRIVRHIQSLGVRIDCLRLLNMGDIEYILHPNGLATRYKEMAFKLAQAWALMDGIELYDKDEIAEKYPELGVFLWRKDPTQDNLHILTAFIRRFLDRVESYPGFSRSLCEDHRNLK